MLLNNQQNFLLTLTLAMCLRIAPFPDVISLLNPDWVVLILIYWILALPYKTGIFSAWTVGLLTDVLTGRALGQYALIYAIIGYFSIQLYKRLRQFPLLQQSVFIFACLLFEHIMVFWIEKMQGPVQISPSFWLPVITGTLFWPFIYPCLDFVRSLGKNH